MAHVTDSENHRIMDLPIDSIEIPDVWRRVNRDIVHEIAQSFRAIGQLSPIEVIKSEPGRFRLRFGRHRVEAAIECSWTNIKGVIRDDVEPAQDDLARLDENIARASYSCVLEESIAYAQRKAIYLENHPETGRGGDRRSSNPRNSALIPAYTEFISTLTRKSQDTVETRVKIGETLGPFAPQLYNTWIEDRTTDLLALSRMPTESIQRGVALIASGEANRMREVRAKLSPREQERPAVGEPKKEVVSKDQPLAEGIGGAESELKTLDGEYSIASDLPNGPKYFVFNAPQIEHEMKQVARDWNNNHVLVDITSRISDFEKSRMRGYKGTFEDALIESFDFYFARRGISLQLRQSNEKAVEYLRSISSSCIDSKND